MAGAACRHASTRQHGNTDIWERSDERAADGYRNLCSGHAVTHPTVSTEAEPASLCEVTEVAADAAPTPITLEEASEGATLRDLDRDLIERALQERRGNVSEVARQLGVSRGLVYRRLRSRTATPV